MTVSSTALGDSEAEFEASLCALALAVSGEQLEPEFVQAVLNTHVVPRQSAGGTAIFCPPHPPRLPSAGVSIPPSPFGRCFNGGVKRGVSVT